MDVPTWATCYAEDMRRLPMFWQIFVTYGLLVAPALALLGSMAVAWGEDLMLREVESDLHERTALLEETVRGRSPEETQPRVAGRRKELGVRITLMDADGRVLVETDKDPHELENHAHRPEIEAAR